MAVQGDMVGLYLSGQPVLITDCNLYVTQPKIKDVVLFGEDEFLICVNLIAHPENLIDQMKQGNSQLEAFSDFQLLLIIMKEEPTIGNSIRKFFNMIFPDYRIDYTDASIDFYIKQEEEEEFIGGRINPFNFDIVKKIIEDLFEPKGDGSEPEYNPANDLAAEIAEKIKRGRERKKKALSDKEGPQSLFGRYTSVLAIGMRMSIDTFYNYTPFQLYDAFNRYFSKVSSDLYTKISTTPLMDISKLEEPKEWVRNLY